MTPERFVLRARRVEARRQPFRWTWAEDNRAAIQANWEGLRQDKPRLFDGRVLLVQECRPAGEVVRVAFFETSYSAFLGWRDHGFPDRTVLNGFAMGALQGSDGAFVMGEMAAHTANAGRVYFAAGTPDPSDVTADGSVDLAYSVARELKEETGLDAAEGAVAPDWVVVRDGPKLAFLKPIRWPEPAERLARRILDHLAAEREPELSGVRIVRGPADIDETAMPDFLQLFLRWAFAPDAAWGAAAQR